jgi:glycosyltransferase involved in cell wall biosynthesis
MSLAFARLSSTPLLHTVHHAPQASEVTLWLGYCDAPFVALSRAQAGMLAGLNVVGIIPHAVDASALPFRAIPDDYLLFLGRFHEAKGVLESIEVARRTGMRLILAAAENQYYREVVAPFVDQRQVVYAGEVGPEKKAVLLGGARALLYPLKKAEPFGLVMAEAMCCGTPVAALDCGAVREVVDDGTTGRVFASLDSLVSGLPEVIGLERAPIRARALERFSPARMVDAYIELYARLARSGAQAFRDTA